MKQLNYSEYDAIEDAKLGREKGYTFLLERYRSYAYSVAIQIVENEQDAEEVVQDSFFKAFRALIKFKNLGKFSTWLYRIVYNTSLTKKRGKRIDFQYLNETSYHLHELPDDYKNGLELLSDKDISNYLKKAIDKLSEAEKVTSTLYYLNECSIAEIRTITNKNESTIKSCLYRSRQKLYHELNILLNKELKDITHETKFG